MWIGNNKDKAKASATRSTTGGAAIIGNLISFNLIF